MAVFGGEKNPIGLAVVGCGRVGRIRARCAREYPGTEWLGCCDIDEKKGRAMAEEFGADFFHDRFHRTHPEARGQRRHHRHG